MHQLLAFILFVLVAATQIVGAQWQVQQAGVNSQWNSVCFINADTGFVVSGNANGLRTTNGGQHWAERASNASYLPAGYSVQFTTLSVGYIAGNAITKTTDGGSSWRVVHNHPQRSQSEEAKNAYKAISFQDDSHGVAAGFCWDCSAMVTTLDGGETWVESIPSSYLSPMGDCRVVSFSPVGTGFAGCWTMAEWLQYAAMYLVESGSDIWRPVDGWTLQPGSAFFIAKTMDWQGAKVGWIGGNKKSPQRDPPYPYSNARVLFTTDAGETWDTTQYSFPYTVNTIAFADSLRGFVGDTAGNIYSTTDGGTTWNNDNVPSNGRSINSICVAGDSRVFAVGDSGLILRLDLPVSVGEYPSTESPLPALRLVPNPATGRVRVETGGAEIATVTVVDVLGKVLAVPRSGTTLDTSMLPAGMYVVMARVNNAVTSAMLIIRNQ